MGQLVDNFGSALSCKGWHIGCSGHSLGRWCGIASVCTSAASNLKGQAGALVSEGSNWALQVASAFPMLCLLSCCHVCSREESTLVPLADTARNKQFECCKNHTVVVGQVLCIDAVMEAVPVALIRVRGSGMKLSTLKVWDRSLWGKTHSFNSWHHL